MGRSDVVRSDREPSISENYGGFTSCRVLEMLGEKHYHYRLTTTLIRGTSSLAASTAFSFLVGYFFLRNRASSLDFWAAVKVILSAPSEDLGTDSGIIRIGRGSKVKRTKFR